LGTGGISRGRTDKRMGSEAIRRKYAWRTKSEGAALRAKEKLGIMGVSRNEKKKTWRRDIIFWNDFEPQYRRSHHRKRRKGSRSPNASLDLGKSRHFEIFAQRGNKNQLGTAARRVLRIRITRSRARIAVGLRKARGKTL